VHVLAADDYSVPWLVDGSTPGVAHFPADPGIVVVHAPLVEPGPAAEYLPDPVMAVVPFQYALLHHFFALS